MLRWCGAPFFCAVTGGMPAVFGGFLRGGEGCVVFCVLWCVCVAERVVFGVGVSL